jgi:hypothetical protein
VAISVLALLASELMARPTDASISNDAGHRH